MTTDEAPSYGITPERSGYYLRFGMAKLNYGLPQEERWFERKEGGVLLPVDLPLIKTTPLNTPKKENNNGKFHAF
jgi:hypothetical protein